jgi:hypothetical protein
LVLEVPMEVAGEEGLSWPRTNLMARLKEQEVGGMAVGREGVRQGGKEGPRDERSGWHKLILPLLTLLPFLS